MNTTQTKAQDSPAADAAGVLLRIGFGLLVLVAPVAALFSRRAFVVLVPVGALLIFLAALLRDTSGLFERIRKSLLSPLGISLMFCAFWAALSLVWTPFPAPAAERLFRTIGIGVLAAGVVSALPERMRGSNLHLMTIGVVVATIALIMASILGPAAVRILRDPEAPTTARAAIAAGVMVWPAVAWTLTRARDWQSYALIAISVLAIAASGSFGAAIITVFALVVFLAARAAPNATATTLAVVSGAFVLLAPALSYVSRAIVKAFKAPAESALSEIALWADVISAAPARLVTGHGFDTALRARLAGLVNPQATGGLVSDVWFDLGLIGGAGLALILFLTFRALGRLVQPMAATSLAAATAVLLFGIIDPTSTQVWWLCVTAVAAVTLGAVNNGQYRTVRPAASLGAGPPRRPEAPIER